MTAILVVLSSVVGVAQGFVRPDWTSLATRYPAVQNMFGMLTRDGYVVDTARAIDRTSGLFVLSSLPVFPGSSKALDPKALQTAQPVASLITSILESQLQEVVPTEVLIVYARLDGPDSVAFRGEPAGSRATVIEGRYDVRNRSIDVKLYETLLARAARRLDAQPVCRDQLYKGESERCDKYDAGCIVAAWIYADDQCKRRSLKK